ncbi:DUF4311 domain-containing protein [Caproiciproducens sp.]
MLISLILKSVIIGVLVGGAAGAGAARMFHVPEIQAMGAFRTLGEMNACQGDAIAHLSFGGSFILSSAGQALASGCLTQDVLHRVVPNVSAGLLLLKNKNVEETVYNPFKMGCVGAVVGAVVVTLLNSAVSFVPVYVTNTMNAVFAPTIANYLIVMQVLFLIAALDNGKATGAWGILLGGLSFFATSNATPGLILGILTGQTIQKNGVKSKISIVFIILMVVIWTLICYFRGFFPNLINSFSTII